MSKNVLSSTDELFFNRWHTPIALSYNETVLYRSEKIVILIQELRRLLRFGGRTGICGSLNDSKKLEIDGHQIVQFFLARNKHFREYDGYYGYPLVGCSEAFFGRPWYLPRRVYFWSRFTEYGRARRLLVKRMITFYESELAKLEREIKKWGTT